MAPPLILKWYFKKRCEHGRSSARQPVPVQVDRADRADMVDMAVCPPTDALITELKCSHLRGALSAEAWASASETEGWVKDEKKANRTAVKDSTVMETKMKTWCSPAVMMDLTPWFVWSHLQRLLFISHHLPRSKSPTPKSRPHPTRSCREQRPCPCTGAYPDYMKVGHLREHLHENISPKQDFFFSFGS